jgi:dCTP deaminase
MEDVPPNADGSVTIPPQVLILGITEEHVELPIDGRLAARVEGRSTLGRIGLAVHVTAPTIHSGFRGKITLEIVNHGTLPILLRPGLRVCQLIVEQVFGTPGRQMSGVFQDQKSTAGG